MISKGNNFFQRRSDLLKSFFNQLGFKITLLGDINAPLLVTDNNIVLSCYVHNFDLVFTNRPHDAVEVFRIKLKKSNTVESYSELFFDWLITSEHRTIYFIKSKDYYFYKHINKNENDFCPLWIKNKDFAYFVFSLKRAEELLSEIKKSESNASIV